MFTCYKKNPLIQYRSYYYLYYHYTHNLQDHICKTKIIQNVPDNKSLNTFQAGKGVQSLMLLDVRRSWVNSKFQKWFDGFKNVQDERL